MGATTRSLLAVLLGAAVLLTGCDAVQSITVPQVESSSGSLGKPAVEQAADPLSALAPDAGYASVSPAPYEWLEEPGYIAHGMGGVAGKRVTNSLEAFQNSYERGYRVFEVDLVFTSDEHLVARHDWMAYMYDLLGQEVEDPYATLTLEQFKGLPIHGDMTPLAIEDVVTIMKAYPDVYFVTDTKSKEPAEVRKAMEAIVDAMGSDTVLADRFIVQIYGEQMLADVRSVHDFKNIIYTLYQIEGTTQQAFDFAKTNGVRVVAMPDTMWTEALGRQAEDRGLTTAVYTVNDQAVEDRMREAGVEFIYSDYLGPR